MTRLRLLVGCAASLLGFFAMPVHAVAPTGGAVVDLRVVAANFADCAVRMNAALARAIILKNLSSGQISKDPVARRIINDACMMDNGSDNAIGPAVAPGLRFRGDLFRYSLADALIRKDYPAQRHFDFTAVAALQHNDPAPLPAALASGTDSKSKKAQQAFTEAQVTALFSHFGECVARRDPDNAHKLLLSPVLTDAEKEAFSALIPSLGQCLTSGQLRLSREVARGLVALNFYRLAGAPAGAEVMTLKGGPDA